jgi:hypothetical protein
MSKQPSTAGAGVSLSRRRTRLHPAQTAAKPQPSRFGVVRSPSVGRVIVHTEPWSKITMMMEDRHVAYLDLVTLFMRLRHHRPVARAEIIRALVEFMQKSEIDFTQFSTIEDMTESLTAYFQQIPNRGRMPLLESGLFRGSHFERERGGCEFNVSSIT